MKARQVVGVALVAAAFVLVGILDKQDAELAQRQYCQNVHDGVWPDYQGTYKADCGGKNPPKFNADLTK